MIKVVVMNGSAEVGKNSFVTELGMVASDYGVSVCPLSSIDEVKHAGTMLGIPVFPKTDAKRALWNKIKTAWTEYDDGPFKRSVEKIESIMHIPRQLPTIDIREPVEIAKLKNHYSDGCLTVLVYNPRQTHVPDNPADRNVKDFSYDIIVNNDTDFDTLHSQARSLFYMVAKKNGYDISIKA